MEIEQIGIDKLVPNKRNLHLTIADVSDLTASIPIVGFLQPLVVVPGETDGEYVVIVGHRRRVAAIEMKLESVPCIIADNKDAAMQVASMLIENTHRQGLTATEEAKGYEQLALFDWEPERIAKVANRPLQHVKDALKLTTLPTAAQQAADDGQLDLPNAAQLADEFGDDSEAMATILDKGSKGHWGIQHAFAEEKRRRDRKQLAEDLREQLILDGVKVTAKPKGWPYECPEAPAVALADEDGNRLDPDEVKARPGFRAFIDTTGEPSVEVYCTDPEEWGYQRTGHTRYVSDRDKAIQAKEEAERATRIDALNTAAEVRQHFCRERYRSAKAVKDTYLTALREMAADPARLRIYGERVELADALAGTSVTGPHDKAGIDRLMRVIVARWISVCEGDVDSMARYATVDGARRVTGYFARLVTDGYALSETEEEFQTELSTFIAEQDANELREEDEQVDNDGEDDEDDEDESEEDDDVSVVYGEAVTAA